MMNNSDAKLPISASPASRACQDVIQCIFSFLTLSELVRAARCCAQWYDWSVKSSGRTDKVRIYSRDDFQKIAQSQMLKHVASIESYGICVNEAINHLRISTTLTHLNVSTWPCEHQCEHVTFQLPPSLTHLSVDIVWGLQNVIDGLHTAVRLRSLQLRRVRGDLPDGYTFSQLARLRHLEQLEVQDRVVVTKTDLLIIKQITSLRFLNILYANWSADDLHTLCEPPHTLHNLECITLFHTHLSVEHLMALQHIPTMTTLEPASMRSHAIRTLHHYLPTTCVQMRIAPHTDDPLTIDMLDGIDLTHMKRLSLFYFDLSSDAGVRFLCTRLPTLNDLRLPYCTLPTELSRLHRINAESIVVKDSHITQSIDMPTLQAFKDTMAYQ